MAIERRAAFDFPCSLKTRPPAPAKVIHSHFRRNTSSGRRPASSMMIATARSGSVHSRYFTSSARFTTWSRALAPGTTAISPLTSGGRSRSKVALFSTERSTRWGKYLQRTLPAARRARDVDQGRWRSTYFVCAARAAVQRGQLSASKLREKSSTPKKLGCRNRRRGKLVSMLGDQA
jgi:hypothetical protein